MNPGSILRPLGGLMLACAIAALGPALRAAEPTREPITVAVAEFAYIDQSGGVMEQGQLHADRIRTLVQQVRDGLDQSGRYRVLPLTCGSGPCGIGRTDPAEMLAQARAAGARLLVYGGIQKMNAMLQYGNAEVVDLEADRLVFDRNIPFRNDSDEAWRHAASFLIAELMKEELVKSAVATQ